jgi:ABC-type phosphate transport system substrate-binding protein
VRVAPSTVRRALRARLLAGTAAVLAALSVGILAPARSASAASFTRIHGAGSTWAQNAISTWAADEAANGLTVDYAAAGSATGRQYFGEGVVDFAASEIPFGVPDGSNSNPAPSRGYAYVPDVAGGAALTYNLSIGSREVINLRLSGAVVAGIFTNQITMWNDPRIAADNPGIMLPAIPVIPVVPFDSSGETWAFTRWMNATEGSYWTAYCQAVGLSPCTATTTYPVQPGTAMVGESGDTGVVDYMDRPQADGAIGLTVNADAIFSGFPAAKVLNAAGYYTAPTPDNVGLSLLSAQVNSDGTANLSPVYTDTDPRTYELSYYSYMIVPTASTFTYPLAPGQGNSLGSFGSYLLCQGQQKAAGLGYAALPINLVEDGFTRLQQIPGGSLPATTSAFIAGCNNPTVSSNGTDNLSATAPMPPACDQQAAAQCTPTTRGQDEAFTTLRASPSVAAVGQPVTLTASVFTFPSYTTPVGSVQFEVGGTDFGTPVTLNSSGVATTTDVFTTAGTQELSAVFTPADPTAFTSSTDTASVMIVTGSNPIGIPVTVTNAPAGAFSFTVPTTSTITMSVNGNTATGAINPVTVSDTRNTYPGWSVVGQATAFTDPTSNPAGDIPGNQLGWVPTSTSLSDGAVLGITIAPASPGLGTTVATLASANAGTGFGTSALGANLTLAIPPTAPSGDYSGVLTLTAEPGTP